VTLHNTEPGLIFVKLRVLSHALCAGFRTTEHYYGPSSPNIAFVQVNAAALTPVRFDDATPSMGADIAIAGYPTGDDLLTAPGHLHHISPTLQRGIVSAVLPFASRYPHALMVDIMTLGGESGSPVFQPHTGRVVGMVCSGFTDDLSTSIEHPHDEADTPHTHTLKIPTNFTYVVPSRLILGAMATPDVPNWRLPPETETLATKVDRQRTRPVIIPRRP